MRRVTFLRPSCLLFALLLSVHAASAQPLWIIGSQAPVQSRAQMAVFLLKTLEGSDYFTRSSSAEFPLAGVSR